MKKIYLVLALAALCSGCKKDWIDPQKPVDDGTVLHEEEVDVPNVWNPFKTKSHYYSDVDGQWRYVAISNNGVIFDIPASDLDKNFKDNPKKWEKKEYTWKDGFTYTPVKLLFFDKIFQFRKVDATGTAIGDTIDYRQLPAPPNI
jgi:hypothetical protein